MTLPHPISDAARVWRCGEYSLPLGAKTYVMAILNATPNSFSGDGLSRGGAMNVQSVVENARRLVDAGADILDIGGESTRPGAEIVSQDEEAWRVLPLVEALSHLGVPLSIDTTKSEIARHAIEAGASIINDVSGALADEAMLRVLAPLRCGVILMHRRGTSQTMNWSEKHGDKLQNDAMHKNATTESNARVLAESETRAVSENARDAAPNENASNHIASSNGAQRENAPRVLAVQAEMARDAAKTEDDLRVLAASKIETLRGDAPHENAPRVLATPESENTRGDIIAEILRFWRARLEATRALGINDTRLCFDAGFGFGKSLEENLEIVRRGGELSAFGFPTLSATSRKSSIARVLAENTSREYSPESNARLFGTAATTALAIAGGCDIVRVHDVQQMAQVARLCDAVTRVR